MPQKYQRTKTGTDHTHFPTKGTQDDLTNENFQQSFMFTDKPHHYGGYRKYSDHHPSNKTYKPDYEPKDRPSYKKSYGRSKYTHSDKSTHYSSNSNLDEQAALANFSVVV